MNYSLSQSNTTNAGISININERLNGLIKRKAEIATEKEQNLFILHEKKMQKREFEISINQVAATISGGSLFSFGKKNGNYKELKGFQEQMRKLDREISLIEAHILFLDREKINTDSLIASLKGHSR